MANITYVGCSEIDGADCQVRVKVDSFAPPVEVKIKLDNMMDTTYWYGYVEAEGSL